MEDVPEEIRPSASLWSRATSAITDWVRVDRSWSVLSRVVTGPVQLTVRGAAIPGAPAGGIMEAYRRRHDAESLITRATTAFMTDPDLVSARVSYAPILLLAWWCRCASDEIDWIRAADGDSPADPWTVVGEWTEGRAAPPRFTPGELDSTAGLRDTCAEVLILQGRNPSAAGDVAAALASSVHDQDGMADAICRLAVSRPPVESAIGIDLETTGVTATRDWVVDAGWVHASLRTGVMTGRVRRSYGVPPVRADMGNPTDSVSGVTTEDVRGLTPLDLDDAAQAEILSAVSSATMVAHVATAEDSFLRLTVAGYAEARRDGIIRIIDSRLVSKRLDEYAGKPGNRLEDYARRWGALPGRGSERHLGLEDSEIMMLAMSRHLRVATGMREWRDLPTKGWREHGITRDSQTG